ncbi:DctP family TRAP transporter solute-binding subunit [Photobacterium sp. BZF1]|uniref:DctP family TRAP transporter solute-binding subunit n=1 Tax=Photobacterium sp. BZF1 TaxID=1904457 RepID=UPI0016538A9D|nr:DctP family TRAP transporter solute-binding subunit [Photobacterium sp. BZF1]MBC7003106.1 DctP family TRAP transporter solute-binding subunit [Photobacterium sp. BZF1]
MKFAKSIVLLSSLLITPHVAASNIKINIGHVDSQEWTVSKKGAATQVFKNLVEAESGGRIQVDIFPAGQLGGETELLQSVQEGMLSMTIVSGAFSKVCPEAAIIEIPYLFPSSPVAWEVLDGEFGQNLSEHCRVETGLKTLAYGETGFRHFTNSKKEIAKPEDLKGMKMRVMPNQTFIEFMKVLDAMATPIAAPELPAALTTGVIDGQENPVSVIVEKKLYELQKYITLDGHVYSADFLVINDNFYSSLNQADREIIDRSAKIAGTVGRAIQQINSAQGLETIIKEGMNVRALNSEELNAFRNASQPKMLTWLSTKIDPKWINQAQESVKNASTNI